MSVPPGALEGTSTPVRQQLRLNRPLNRACVVCHARKVKCDGFVNSFPCANCKAAKIECLVTRRQRRRKPATARAASLPQPAEDATVQRNALPVQDDSENAFATVDRDQQAREESPGTSVAMADAELAKQQLVEFVSQDLQNAPIRCRLSYVGNSLSNLYHLVRQRSPKYRDVHHYPCSNANITSAPNRHPRQAQLTYPALIPKDAFILPPRHVSDELVANYFALIHPGFPIIDKDDFLGRYHTQPSSASVLLLQSICLAGSHVSPGFKDRQSLKTAFFRRAKALFNGRFEEDRMNMVQAALLLTWFSDGGDDVCANAWWWIGLAYRTAIGIGMHRDVSRSNMPENDKRTWKHIWWSLVQFDCLVSLFYGRPQNINLDHCDVPPLQDDDFEPSMTTHQANFVKFHARLCTLVNDLVQSHFTVKARKSPQASHVALNAIETALVDWLLSLPADLRRDEKSPGQDYSLWTCLLHLTYNTVLVQLHRPFATSEMSSEGSDPARSDAICEDASSNIIDIFHDLAAQEKLHNCWFWAPSALFAAMLQLRGQLKSKSKILALKASQKYESGLLSFDQLSKHWLYAETVANLLHFQPTQPVEKVPPSSAASISSTHRPTMTGDSTTTTVALIESSPSTSALLRTAEVQQSQCSDMDWTEMAVSRCPDTVFLDMDQLRSHNSMIEWQSLYWNDPIAGMTFEDTLDNPLYQWPFV